MEKTVNSTSVKAIINGKEEAIILGYSVYNMERPKDKKGLVNLIDKDSLLDVIFHFARPEIFWEAGIELKDANGKVIEKGTPNVLIPTDTAGTYWRFTVDEVLKNVQVHDFKDIHEYGKAIGNTNLYSRKPSNVENLGYASLTSEDVTYTAIFNTAKKFNITMNAAMLYYGVRLKQDQTLRLAMGCEVPDVPELKRSVQEAEELIEMVGYVLGEKEIGKRYAINSINAVVSKFDFPTVMNAMSKLPASTVTLFKLSECNEKEGCLVAELILFIEELKSSNKAVA